MGPRGRHGFALTAIMAGLAATAPARAESPRERGAYLVNVLAACANCHTPKTPTGPGPALSGGSKFGPPDSPVYAPNITPDRATGIGTWTDNQIASAIERGVRPDGSRIGPPMPQMAYRAMTDSDARAIVAYLRSVTPVSHIVPPAPHKPRPSAKPTTATKPVAPGEDRLAQGRYIATALSHCTECHSPLPSPDGTAHLDEGGRIFATPKGKVVAPGITAKDLSRFTDAQLTALIEKGVRPDGSKLEGPMPVRSYAGYKPADFAALVAFLRSDQAAPKP